MLRRIGAKSARGLLELPFATDSVAATGLVPRDGEVDEALIKVALFGGGRAPRVLELLVCGEELAAADQVEAALE